MVNKKMEANNKEENKMAALITTVNHVQDIVELKSLVVGASAKIIEILNSVKKTAHKTKEVETISIDINKLSDDDIKFLDTYHLMIDEQNEFVKNVAQINYECLVQDEDDEDYSDW